MANVPTLSLHMAMTRESRDVADPIFSDFLQHEYQFGTGNIEYPSPGVSME